MSGYDEHRDRGLLPKDMICCDACGEGPYLASTFAAKRPPRTARSTAITWRGRRTHTDGTVHYSDELVEHKDVRRWWLLCYSCDRLTGPPDKLLGTPRRGTADTYPNLTRKDQ